MGFDSERAFESHHRSVWRYLAVRVGVDAADDLLSEVFLVALERSTSYDPAAGTELAWLLGISRNLTRSWWRTTLRRQRATQRLRRHSDVTSTSDLERADERMSASREADTVLRRLQGLSSSQRDVIGLVGFAGLSYEEAARLLGVPVGTVRSRLSRARAILENPEL